MFIDRLVIWMTTIGVSFVLGMLAGEEHAAVSLKPCPDGGKASLIKSEISGQVCTYAEIVRGGGKFKWSIKSI